MIHWLATLRVMPEFAYSPLLPLAVLLLTGLYLFVLPHATRWRDRRSGSDGLGSGA